LKAWTVTPRSRLLSIRQRGTSVAAKSNPENGPRVSIDHGKTIETQILVERAPGHPCGPGVSVISTYESKKGREK